MKRLFLVPGMAKAGTTFLFDQLVKSRDAFNIPDRKEISLFQKNTGVSEKKFLQRFPNGSENRIYLDVSPVYLNAGPEVAGRVAEVLPGWDIRVLILVRDPVSTLFSHYLHDLKSHYGRLSSPRARPARYSLADDAVLRKYIRPKYETIRAYCGIFENRCAVMPMDALFDGRAETRIERLLGVALTAFNHGIRSNEGGFVPQYHYGGENGATFVQDGTEYRVPPRTLVSAANSRSEIQNDVAPDTAEKILSLAQSFTKEIELPREKIEALILDHRKICEAFDLPAAPENEKQTFAFTAEPGKVSKGVLETLAKH